MDETDLKLQAEKVTPEDLEEIGFIAVCIGLPLAIAENMKSHNPGSVIILDDLNEGFYALMKRKPENAKIEDIETSILEPKVGKNNIGKDTGQISDIEFEL